MKTKKLGIEPNNILDYISITGVWVQCTDAESEGYVSAEKIATIAQETEARVFSALPEIYRMRCSGQIDGLILTTWADGGETTFTLPEPFINNVKSLTIYKNFPSDFNCRQFRPVQGPKIPYSARTPEYKFTAYTFTAETGKVVLSDLLEPGDSLICDIKYISSAWIVELVEVTKKLAASNIIPSLPSTMNGDSMALRQSQLYTDSYGFLNRLKPEGGKSPQAGISSIDELPIISPERIRSWNLGSVSAFGKTW